MDANLGRQPAMRINLTWHRLGVGALGLIWSLIAFAEFGILGMDMAQITGWAQTFVAAAVWGGFAGSLLLLARSHWALQAFVVGLVGVMGMSVQLFVLNDMAVSLTSQPVLLGLWVISLTTLFYTSRVSSLGQLR